MVSLRQISVRCPYPTNVFLTRLSDRAGDTVAGVSKRRNVQ